jgi:hypothetical protein
MYTNIRPDVSSHPVCAMVWEGCNAVMIGRATIGATAPLQATPGTIRGNLAFVSCNQFDALGLEVAKDGIRILLEISAMDLTALKVQKERFNSGLAQLRSSLIIRGTS